MRLTHNDPMPTCETCGRTDGTHAARCPERLIPVAALAPAGVCGNCGQWQWPVSDARVADCTHECRRRGFEPAPPLVALLRHYRAFLASPYERMRDPYDRDRVATLSKAGAQRELTWLVHMAISRRGGECLAINRARAGAGRNHRGQPRRKEDADYQRGLRLDAAALNQPRLRIRYLSTPELRRRYAARLAAGRED